MICTTSTQELARRKAVLALRAVSEPARLSEAIGSLWAAYVAVLATLRFQFAQTTALALGIVETVQLPLVRVLAPAFAALLGSELSHWVETGVDVLIKLVALIVAWWLQMVVSAANSALRGGRLFADGLCALIAERGWSSYVEQLPGVTRPFDPDTSYFDEAVAYALAGVGFLAQLLGGFTLGFPLNIVLLPLELIEWLLRWQITWSGPPEDAAMASG